MQYYIDCPSCGAALCVCDCLEQQLAEPWRYYDCFQCGIKAGTKCNCLSTAESSTIFERVKELFRKAFK
jgi:hypothetical protein